MLPEQCKKEAAHASYAGWLREFYEEGYQSGYKNGHEQGLKEGRHTCVIYYVQRMLMRKCSKEEIAETLSIKKEFVESVERLMKENESVHNAKQLYFLWKERVTAEKRKL